MAGANLITMISFPTNNPRGLSMIWLTSNPNFLRVSDSVCWVKDPKAPASWTASLSMGKPCASKTSKLTVIWLWCLRIPNRWVPRVNFIRMQTSLNRMHLSFRRSISQVERATASWVQLLNFRSSQHCEITVRLSTKLALWTRLHSSRSNKLYHQIFSSVSWAFRIIQKVLLMNSSTRRMALTPPRWRSWRTWSSWSAPSSSPTRTSWSPTWMLLNRSRSSMLKNN